MIDPLERLAALSRPIRVDAHARLEHWSLRQPFVISRGVQHDVALLVVELSDGALVGRGECCPVAHYGETPEGTGAAIEGMLERLRGGEAWASFHDAMPAGAARNAVDCAVWDLTAKQLGRPVHALLERPTPARIETVLTISVATPEAMATAARAASDHSILKLKLGGAGDDLARVAAVRTAVPDKRLIADANEAWSLAQLVANLPAMARARIEMLEQPLTAGADSAVGQVTRNVPIGADESCHVSADLARVAPLYDLVNIKLDKTGGLTEAMRLLAGAKALQLGTMVGCMLGTSLAMAPALLIASECAFVDLDAPLLMGKDRTPALHYVSGWIDPADQVLWG